MSTSQYHYSQNTFSQKFPNHDTFKFLVSTDTHLGYKETHNIRKNDSFEAFEEVLEKAKENNVDFLLLGGDLFHDLNPSQESLYKCLRLLKERIFGDKQIEYQTFWEDQAPNYSNENMNISLPIFIIHGNHDYPSNEYGNLSTLDLLHAGNYLNYFGKFTNYDNIVVKPILFHKKGTKIALYGLGHIKDVRLHYLLQNNKIQFVQPEESPETYFHILVIHQNRFKGIKNWSYKNSIHPKMFPSYFNLIIWAHEHESMPDIEQSSEIQAYIYQPGSSIATSLIEAETKTKHAGLFTFRKNEFYFEPIFLKKSERTLIYRQIELGNFLKKKGNLMNEEAHEEVEKYLEGEIEETLKEFEKNHEGEKKLPLVRLKIEYSGFDIIRIQRLEAKFKGRIANEGEILKFWKKKPEVDEEAIQNNVNMTTRFSECFKAKTSFNTLGNESVNDIRQMYEDELKKTEFKILNPSIFLEKVDNINFRNRQTLLSDFFSSGLSKINNEIFQKERQNISKMISEFNQKSDLQLNYLKNSMKNPGLIKEDPPIQIKTNFEGEITGFLENLKKTVFSLTTQHINTVFKPESQFLEDTEKAQLSVTQPSKQRGKKAAKKSGVNEPVDEFEDEMIDDDFDGKSAISMSTNMSFGLMKNPIRKEEKKRIEDEDFSDKNEEFIEKAYKINVLGVEKTQKPKKSENSPKKQKKKRDVSKEGKKKTGKNETKSIKEEQKTMKTEENKPVSEPKNFLNDYLNPKKRKEEVPMKKPEKMEKKDEKVMNAESFLGALLEKKTDGSFHKQRVFGNSPLVSKSKEKKSGNNNEFF